MMHLLVIFAQHLFLYFLAYFYAELCSPHFVRGQALSTLQYSKNAQKVRIHGMSQLPLMIHVPKTKMSNINL